MKDLVLKQPMMTKVLYSLIPIVLFSVFLFGLRILVLLAVSNLLAFLTEYLFIRNKKNGKVSSAVFVTGTLLALIVPPALPFWMLGVGAVIAVLFGKMVFGGFGMNIFNPAMVGRTFIYITFANQMTAGWSKPFTSLPGGFAAYGSPPLLTGATAMANEGSFSLSHLFLGLIPGSAGETSALLILLAGIYLIMTKTAKWQSIVATLISFLLFTAIFYFGSNPLYYLLSGGLLFGTIFMVTDPVSSPKNKYGIWINGLMLGFLTVFIRKYSLWPEGFMFALLICNMLMPIIEYGLNKINLK